MRQAPKDIRNRLMKAAAEEFADKRFDGASLNFILEKAQVSKGRFYYYFADKAALFAAVIEDLFLDMSKGLAGLASSATSDEFWAGMQQLVEEGWKAYAEDSILRSLSHQALEMASQPGHPLEDILEKILSELHRALSAGRRIGAIRQDMDLSLLTNLMAAIDTAADRWTMSRDDMDRSPDIEEISRTYVDIYKRLLLPADSLAAQLDRSLSDLRPHAGTKATRDQKNRRRGDPSNQGNDQKQKHSTDTAVLVPSDPAKKRKPRMRKKGHRP